MARFHLLRSTLLILCLGAAHLPAQEPEMIPPPIPSVLPPEPPDPDTLPPPPQLEWAPLGPQGGEEEGGGVVATIVPPPLTETPIEPPPPPIVETPVAGLPDPEAVELVKPEVEIWREGSEWPQIPARTANRLDKAYMTGTEPVWLRAQFNPAAAGKRVLVRPGRGLTVVGTGAALTISSTGECLVQAQLAEGIERSHLIFYCDGIRTVLPVVRAPLATVIGAEEETGGAH
jgi:hypothetical protein